MWETDWAKLPARSAGTAIPAPEPVIDIGEIAYTNLLHWREHCVECAPPQCYSECHLFVAREDLRCARFKYGIVPDPQVSGLYPFGADICFRRWAKLESKLYLIPTPVQRARRLAALDRMLFRGSNGLATVLAPLNRTRKINFPYLKARDLAFAAKSRAGKITGAPFDEFLIQAFNPMGRSIAMMLEIHEQVVVYRESLTFEPGWNLHRISLATLNLDYTCAQGRIMFYAGQDDEVRLVFTWLDFVKYRTAASEASGLAPAPKVKCVAWDLDNTLWDGILIEDGPEKLRLRPRVAEVIRALDERGILQTLASKNDYEHAWAQVAKFGLDEYFLAPAIHWDPKSGSLIEIAKVLNINVDTFALIDDQAFEREEVRARLPQVRVYSHEEIERLLGYPEFDVPITEEGRARRRSYQVEVQRKRISQSYGDNYRSFLTDCNIRLKLFSPDSELDRTRCLELLQRSNQLNLTTYRYSETEFRQLLDDPSVLCIATACEDRFGDYGLVGFAAVRLGSDAGPVLMDFVLSCRVARKKVENAWFNALGILLKGAGHGSLRARFIPTDRNGVLWDVLREVGFEQCGSEEGARLIERAQDFQDADAALVSVDSGRLTCAVKASAS